MDLSYLAAALPASNQEIVWWSCFSVLTLVVFKILLRSDAEDAIEFSVPVPEACRSDWQGCHMCCIGLTSASCFICREAVNAERKRRVRCCCIFACGATPSMATMTSLEGLQMSMPLESPSAAKFKMLCVPWQIVESRSSPHRFQTCFVSERTTVA